MSFADRRDAGRRLAARLRFLRGEDAVVLALPRGGVPVAFEVARALAVPMDVIVVRKLGVPFQPELAMGAIGEGGVVVVNDEVLRLAGVTPSAFAQVEQRARAELDHQARRYRGHRPRAQVAGRTVVVVDDGVATGSTARAACQVAKAQGAARVVLAVPVAPASTVEELEREAEVVCVEAPRHLWAVGQWYRDFTETSDQEVARLLYECAPPAGAQWQQTLKATTRRSKPARSRWSPGVAAWPGCSPCPGSRPGWWCSLTGAAAAATAPATGS